MTNTRGRHDAWFALADAEHCRLLCCRLTWRGTQHFDECGTFAKTVQERERPLSVSRGDRTHGVEDEERRFADALVEWLRGKWQEHQIEHLVILASPHMLGVLRKASSGLIEGRFQELDGNLMRLDIGQLAGHPMVRRLVKTACEA